METFNNLIHSYGMYVVILLIVLLSGTILLVRYWEKPVGLVMFFDEYAKEIPVATGERLEELVTFAIDDAVRRFRENKRLSAREISEALVLYVAGYKRLEGNVFSLEQLPKETVYGAFIQRHVDKIVDPTEKELFVEAVVKELCEIRYTHETFIDDKDVYYITTHLRTAA